ncbi:MAG: hypothetical protein ABR903_03285 [Thermodesulfovibrionales bacterium]|jgi:cysteine synthase A
MLTVSETMSIERRLLLQAYGAEIVLTPGEQGMLGAWERAEKILRDSRDFFMPLQFENAANLMPTEKQLQSRS